MQNSGLYSPWKASETYAKAVEVLHEELAQHRDDLYAQAFYHVLESQKTDSPIAGVNFWAWGGEGRPAHIEWQPGDNAIGDRPHAAQVGYSIYDNDASTLKLTREVAGRIK